jgi:NDP-sugar pyrophosphorylase family protein
MGVRNYEFQVPYGVVNLNNGEIVSISEKPVYNFFVSGGIYMLSPEILKFIPDNEFFDMPTLFERIIESKNTPVSFPIHDYWLDVGRINDYEQANSEYSKVF